MPTLPITAKPIPAPDAPLAEVIQRGFEMVANTAPFDATGHPAMSLPCGLDDGLPVGLMLVGRHWGEATIYRGRACLRAGRRLARAVRRSGVRADRPRQRPCRPVDYWRALRRLSGVL